MTYGAKLTRSLLSATMLTGVVVATQASAQTEGAADAAAEAPAAETFGDTIIVTGTRRATTIQDTPINISAIGAEDLARQRIDDVRDLADFTPGMTISDTGQGSTGSIVLRGLSASDVGDGGTN